MIKKYKILLENDREIGPLSPDQIGLLYNKGHISLNDSCKIFPSGDWLLIKDEPELSKFIRGILSGEVSLKEISEFDSNEMVKLIQAQEQNFEKLEKQGLPSDQKLEEFDYKNVIHQKAVEEKPTLISTENSESTLVESKKSDFNDTTKVLEKNLLLKKEEEEKKRKLELQEKLEQERLAKKEENDKRVAEENAIKSEGQTLIQRRSALLPENFRDMVSLDRELEKIQEVKDVVQVEEIEEEVEEEKKVKLKIIPMIAIAALVWFVLFDDSDSQKQFVPQKIAIVFPELSDFVDEKQGNEALLKGIKYYNYGTHITKVASIAYFKKSFALKPRDNPALGFLIRAYAELLDVARDQEEASQTIYRLVEMGKGQMLFDMNISLGVAKFYAFYEKYESALLILENYIRFNRSLLAGELEDIKEVSSLQEKMLSIVKENSVWIDLTRKFFQSFGGPQSFLSEYIKVSILADNLDKARQSFNQIFSDNREVWMSEESSYSVSSIIAGVKFLREDQRFDDAEILLKKGLKSFPSSVEILLLYSDYLVKNKSIEELTSVLKQIESLKFEESPVFYARYLEQMAVLAALKKKFKVSAELLDLALKVHETDDLRGKISQLEVGNDSMSNIVLESKVKELMREAKNLINERKWSAGIALVIEAIDLTPRAISPRLLLAHFQIKRGYFGLALNTLDLLKKAYPLSLKINKELVLANIESYRLDDARIILENLSMTKLVNSADYAFLLGRLYAKQDQLALTIKWISEGLKRDPLSIENYLFIAKTYLKYRKYNHAKSMILRALEIDPVNVELHSLYAKILYELESADQAIGYLRKNMEEFGNDLKFKSEMAIYYYRSGQLKAFDRIRNEVEKSIVRDKHFYEFLIESLLLEKKYAEAISYFKEYLELNPGDLETRMNFSINLNKLKKYDDSIKELLEIKERLEGYPKLHFYLGLNYFDKKDYEKSLEMAEEEIKLNRHLPEGYYLKGRAHYQLSEYADAIKAFDKTLSMNRNHVETLVLLGEIRFRQDLYGEARKLFLRAKGLDSNRPDIYRHLGYTYMAEGQSILAIESFTTYLKLDPLANDISKIKILIKNLE